MSDSNILRPLPQRKWQLTPTPSGLATPAEPQASGEKSPGLSAKSRTRSILNLTSSTLFGIYQNGGENVQESMPSTPWGTGAMTPLTPGFPTYEDGRRSSGQQQREPELPTKKAFRKRKPIDLVGRTILLFVVGLVYGLFISHLHDNPHITPHIRPLEVKGVNRSSWNYLLTWGVAGAVAGNLIPWLEMLFEEDEQEYPVHANGAAPGSLLQSKSQQGNLLADWSQSLRGIGVFVGIAYAIRKLPWESSSQAALTLALANPGLWYLVDRSRMGFILSTTFATAGTFLLLAINPDLIPQPSGGVDGNLTAFERIQAHGLYSKETIGVFTWIASVVYCSCVCFRSIGKRLIGD